MDARGRPPRYAHLIGVVVGFAIFGYAMGSLVPAMGSVGYVLALVGLAVAVCQACYALIAFRR